MLSHIRIQKKSGENALALCEVEGVDLTRVVTGIQVNAQHDDVPEVFLFFRSDVDIDLDAYVKVVQPSPPKDQYRFAASAIRLLDPKMVEQAALEALEFGGNQNVIVQALEVIAGVLEDAANQLEAPEEVRGSEHDGRSEGDEEPRVE